MSATPRPWETIPADFVAVTWKSPTPEAADAPSITNKGSGRTVVLLELSEQDRRQLIEGNPLYLVLCGPCPVFAVTANQYEALELAREDTVR